MEKTNFHEPKKSVSRAEVMFILQMLLPPNFKIFNKALNKTILFPPDRKFVSTSRN